MLKKVMILVALLGLLTVSVHARSVVYGGMQVAIPGGDSHEIGAGTMFAIGQEISEKFIIWGNANAVKTGEGLSIDQGFVGFTLFSDKFFDFGGLYLNMEGGVGKVEDQDVKFASLVGAGCFFDLSRETKLWLGAGQSNTGGVAIYSIQAGLSMSIGWK